MYKQLSVEFSESHQSPANVLIHLITTPSFYLSLFGIFRLYGLGLGLGLIYATTLLAIPGYFSKALSIITLVTCYFTAEYLELNLFQSLALFLVSYLGQDLGHYLTFEPTFQSRYTPPPGSDIKTWSSFFYKLSSHTYYMLPLVFDCAIEISLFEKVLSWFLVLDRIIKLKLDSPGSVDNLKTIRDWLDSENLSDNVTTHLWYTNLPSKIKNSFSSLASCSVTSSEKRN
jgi:hypothetical protein